MWHELCRTRWQVTWGSIGFGNRAELTLRTTCLKITAYGAHTNTRHLVVIRPSQLVWKFLVTPELLMRTSESVCKSTTIV
jgi:hypothetical protein